MTEEENLVWFEEAKGKKIRWTTWVNGEYCIIREDSNLIGIKEGTVLADCRDSKGTPFISKRYIANGWGANDSLGHKWELCEVVEPRGTAITTLVNDVYCGCADRSPVRQKYNTFSFTLCNNCKKEIK